MQAVKSSPGAWKGKQAEVPGPLHSAAVRLLCGALRITSFHVCPPPCAAAIQCNKDEAGTMAVASRNEGAGAQMPPPGNIASLYSIYVQCHEDDEGPLMGFITGGLLPVTCGN